MFLGSFVDFLAGFPSKMWQLWTWKLGELAHVSIMIWCDISLRGQGKKKRREKERTLFVPRSGWEARLSGAAVSTLTEAVEMKTNIFAGGGCTDGFKKKKRWTESHDWWTEIDDGERKTHGFYDLSRQVKLFTQDKQLNSM